MVDLRFDHVSKKYRIRKAGPADGLLARFRRATEDFWAVRDVSFEVKRGESLGIIGHNGAGKSTVLKLLSSITAPTEGEIMINGRLSALLEVGSGFHPELTGRENIFLSASILGMRRSDIVGNIDYIIEFAELRQFIDVPVKRYSSGMFVRLGFAIAAHLDPDVLLLDEVLAVGDAAFQEKCINRVIRLRDAGKTIVFISHDLAAVERLCSRALLMKRGEVIADGAPSDVITTYRDTASFVSSRPLEDLGKSRGAEITKVQFFDETGLEATAFSTGLPLRTEISYTVYKPINNAVFTLYFHAGNGNEVSAQFTTVTERGGMRLEPGTGTVEFTCTELGLQPGFYTLDVNIEHYGSPDPFDWHSRCSMITVNPGRRLRGQFYMPHRWHIRPDMSMGVAQAGPARAENP